MPTPYGPFAKWNADGQGALGIGTVVAGGSRIVNAGGTYLGAMATIAGSGNEIRTNASNAYDGVANAIVGAVNRTENANAALIFGAGNTVTNSYGNIEDVDPFNLAGSVKDSGGQVLVIGGANSVDFGKYSSVTGVSNVIKGKGALDTSDYNFISGARNKVTTTDHAYVIGTDNEVTNGTGNTLIGDNRILTGVTNSVILGSGVKSDNKLGANNVSNVVVAGYKANATAADGVAIGSNSVASVAAGEIGASPTNTTVSDADKKNSTWTSTLGAVSVGYAATGNDSAGTRQITNVAAGTQDTDAVNLAQLNKVASLISNSAGSGVEYVSIKAANDTDTNKDNKGATGYGSIAIGPNALTKGAYSVALGYKAQIDSNSSNQIAIGSEATAKNNDSIAIGNKANATDGVAIGREANSNTSTSVAMGLYSKANKQGSVSIGYNTVSNDNGTALGYRSESYNGDSAAFGSHARAYEKQSLASGYKATTYSEQSIAIGSQAVVYADKGVALTKAEYDAITDEKVKANYALDPLTMDQGGPKYYKTGKSGYGTAIGYNAEVFAQSGLALGHQASSSEKAGVALGKSASASAENGIALGSNSRVTKNDGVALGSNSKASRTAGNAGYDPSTNSTSSQSIPAWKSTMGAVAVGYAADGNIPAGTRQITNLAAGTYATDAVNVAQLKAARVKVQAATGDANSVTVSSSTATDGSTIYTISGLNTDTDTKVTGGTATYNQATGAGTITVTDSSGDTTNPITIEGLQDTYVTGVTLEDGTLTLTRNAGADLTVNNIATKADLAAIKPIEYFSVNSTATGNKDNKGATGTNAVAIGPNATANGEGSVAIGNNVRTSGAGTVVIGDGAHVTANITLDGHIAIGKNARVFAGGGEQEAKLGFDPTIWPKGGVGGYDKPTDLSRVATGIAMGVNSNARTGSIDIGGRTYNGLMGGKQVSGNDAIGFHVNQTALGTNTYAKGLFSTMLGSYSIATGGSDGSGGGNTMAYGGQNFGATVVGSLNSIRSNEEIQFIELFGKETPVGVSSQGVANTITGVANITENTNGSLIYGAGNKISNSITSINPPTTGAASVDAMVDSLQTAIRNSKSGGATMAFGGGNVADYTRKSAIIGVNNTLIGTAADPKSGAKEYISEFNAITGFENTATNVSHVTATGSNNKITDTDNTILFGDNRTLTGANNSVVMGAASKETVLNVTDATVIGYNANVTVKDGVALGSGSGSIANTAAGKLGYIPAGKDLTDADKATATWTSKLAAVSVGDVATGKTRQITGVAAGTAATDAVNVAQLQAVAEIAENATTAAGKHTVVSVNGGEKATNTTYVGEGNLQINVTNKDGQNTYDIKLKDNLTIGTKGEPGKDGQPGTKGEVGSITIIGENGKDAEGKELPEGNNTSANISVKDGAKGLDGKDGVTRIIYTDENKTPHEVATMDDGLKFAGDDGTTKVVSKKLNEQLDIKGGATDFTENNIAVVADVDAQGNATGLHVKLAKNINLADGSIKFNETVKDADGNSLVKGEDGKWYIDLTGAVYDKDTNTYTKDGNTLQPVTPSTKGSVELSENGLDNGGNKITNVGEGTDKTDAVNKGQLDKAIEDLGDKVGDAHTAITLNGKEVTPGTDKLGAPVQDNNLELAAKIVNGKTTYDIKMSKDLVLGTKGEPGKDGEDGQPGTPGKAGKPGSITIIGENGKDAQGNELPEGNNTSANISVKDGAKGLDGKDGVTRIVYTDENKTPHQVATMDDGLNFAGDDAKPIPKKLNEQLDIKGGADTEKLSDNNIGVVSETKDGKTYLSVKLAKDLTGLTSINVGGIKGADGNYTGGITINNGGINMGGKKITNVGSGIVEGDNKNNTNVANINDVLQLVGKEVEAAKVTAGDNISVENNKVSLKEDITLGKDETKQVEIKGSDGTITAGSGANQVAIDGKDASVKAGAGENQVALDGANGQVTIGQAGDQIIMGNQEVSPIKPNGDQLGTKENGQFITGLDNTTWEPETKGYVPDRAATEGQLKDIADKINNIDTSVKESSRVFAGDEGEGKKVTVKSGETLHLNGGAAVDNLSDGNIGVVTQKDDKGNPTNGLDIKLSKDLKGLNSVTTKELTVTEKANIGDVTIEGDTITVGKGDSQTIINGEGISIPGKDGKDGVNISGEGIDMGGKPITNVGEAVNPGDAINKGQFDKTINDIGNGMNHMSNRISKLDRRVDRVGAGAAALAALHPLEFSPEAKWEVSAGVGNYKGANALALGAFYRPNGDTMFSIGTSLGGSENMVNAGVTLRVGDGETENYPARKVMAQQIKDLQYVVNTQNEKIEQLTQLVNTLVGANQQIQPIVSAPQAQADAETETAQQA